MTGEITPEIDAEVAARTGPATDTDLRALVLACTLTPSPAPSSSVKLGRELLAALETHGVTGELARVVDHDVRFGVATDMGGGDAWPTLRERVLAADIVVLATPIWMGQPASVAKMVLERLDAETAETDDQGRPTMSGKVAGVAVVGNEDGAHHTIASCLQALDDVGFSVASQGTTYWVGEAMEGTDYQDLAEPPAPVVSTTRTAAVNMAHLARLLRRDPYPVPS